MDVNQSRNDSNVDDNSIEKDKAPPSDDDDGDYHPDNDPQPPSDDDDHEPNHLVPAAGDGKFYVRGMEIEGLDDANSSTRDHAVAFYNEAIPLLRSAGKNWQLMLKEKHDTILSAFIRFQDGEKAAYLRGEFPQCYKWFLAYAIVKDGEGGFVLVARPQSELGSHGVSENTPLDKIKRVTYMERVFVDLKKAHGDDHCKGTTILGRMNDHYANVGMNVTKIFTSTCPVCIKRDNRKKPVAGIKPIVTRGMGVRGQVDLIDYQSIPNGDFKDLLNYIDHGVKFLFSIPRKRKRASCIAVALLEIFTVLGPPMILQSDNGCEFNSAAMTSQQRRSLQGETSTLGNCVGLPEALLIKVINEIKLLWPDCRMVRGSPRHSPSNGGVERVNRTINQKLGTWMHETGSTNWSIGCRLMMWRYITQRHCTVDDLPYRLMFGQLPQVGLSELPLSRELIDTLATETQLNKVCNYVGKIIIPNDDKPMVIDDKGPIDEAVALHGSLDNGDDIYAEAGFGEETAEARFNQETALVEMITDVQENNEVLGGIGMAGGVEDEDVSDANRIAVDEVVEANDEDEEEDEEDEQEVPTPIKIGAKRKKALLEKVKAGKTVEVEDIVSRWETTLLDVPDDFHLDQLQNFVRLWQSVPVAWCINHRDNTKVESFVPAYLTRISNSQWEVNDEDDLVMHHLDNEGDEGLQNLIGCGYIKYPSVAHVLYFWAKENTGAVSSRLNEAADHAVSPVRKSLCNRAADNVEIKAKKMSENAMKRMGEDGAKVFAVGEIVHVPLSDFDVAKVDNKALTGVIVEVNTGNMTARIVRGCTDKKNKKINCPKLKFEVGIL